jgi:excisionase family DNA binding protein
MSATRSDDACDVAAPDGDTAVAGSQGDSGEIDRSVVTAHGRATFDVREVARLLGVGRDAVYAAAERGEIPGTIRIGRRLVFSRAPLLAWLGNPASSDGDDNR